MSALPRIADRPATQDERAAYKKPTFADDGLATPLPYRLADDIDEVSRRRPLVQSLIDAGALVGIIGPSGGGKSTVAIHLACCLGADHLFFDRAVTPGFVIYIAAEGGDSVGRRTLAWRRKHQVDGTAVAIVTVSIDLTDPVADVDRVIATAKAIQADRGAAVVAVVVDTLARAFGFGDENSAVDMGAFVANCDKIRLAIGVAVVAVHHTGKDADRGARGSNAFHAAMDTVLRISNQDGVVSIKVDKQRDLPTDETLTAKLIPVKLGEDEWGDISACILEPLTGQAPARQAKPAVKFPKGTDIAMRALRECIAEFGDNLPGTSAVPPGTRATTMARWRDRYFRHDPLDDSQDMKKERDARAKRFQRARLTLQDGGHISVLGDLVWIG